MDPSSGEEICQIAQGGADDVRRAVEAAQAALDGPFKKINPAKRSALMNGLAELIKANGERAGRARIARQRKAARDGEGRRRGVRQPPALLRGLADEDRGRDDPRIRPRRPLLHAPRAGRRLRPDHPVELPAPDGRLEDRSRAGRGLPHRPQARRADPAHRAPPGRARARGRLSARRAQRRHGRRRDRRGAGRRPGRREDRVHGLDGGRAGDRAEMRQVAQARHARAWRKEPEHHPSGRRPRPGDQGLLPGHLLQLRPGMQRRARACTSRASSSTR